MILSWEKGDDNADGFDLFMSIDGGVTYQLLDRTSDSLNQASQRYQTRPLPNGTYHFQVGAYNLDGESARSNTAIVVLDGVSIRFTRSRHADSTITGVNLTESFEAESSDGGDIVYSLVDPADGMTIDAETGSFSWTPSQPGYYDVEVVATLAGNPSVRASVVYLIIVRYGPADLCATITGTVLDDSGSPVPYGWANVIVLLNGRTFSLTEQITNGHFSVAAPAGTMIVEVYGDSWREFYNDASKAEQAERLTLACGDNRTLAFTVEPASASPAGRILGALIDTAGNYLSGRIIAYRIDSNDVPQQAAETWARGGYFELNKLEAGQYVIWGKSNDSVHVPGYHVAGQVAALSWTNATRIDLAENDSAFGATITLVYVEGGGQARLRGTVVSEGGRIRKQEDPRILGTTPVEGATVYALDASNGVSGYTITDANGHFEISELKEGSYTVLVDRVGLLPLYEPVTVTNGAVTDINLAMTSSVANGSTVVAHLEIYPNPVSASATVHFNAAAGKAHLRVIDLRGTEVISMSIATTAGKNSVRLETAALPAGMYLLQVGSGSGSASTMITVGR